MPIPSNLIVVRFLLLKGELQPKILIKAKSNVFIWYVQCCSCTRRSKTKILTTRAPPSWIEFDVVTSQRQTQSASDCVMLDESITGDSQTIFWLLQEINKRINIEINNHKSYSRCRVWLHNLKLNPRWRRHSRQYFGYQSSRAATALHVSKRNITFCFNQG